MITIARGHRTFRYDDDGRLAEEWVQTDNRGFLQKLGVAADR